MFKIWLQSFWRQARRNPLYTGLNLVGLAIGIACGFLVLTYARQELSYDRSTPGADRIFRIATDFMQMGGFAVSQEKLKPYLVEKCPAVELATRFRAESGLKVEVEGKTFQEEIALQVDSHFFQVFQYPFLAGSPEAAMVRGDQIVLNQAIARKYFGDEPALGRTLLIGEEKTPHTIAGVVEAFSGRSHLPAGIWRSIYPVLSNRDSWTSAAYYNYVLLKPGQDQAALESFFEQVKKEEIHPQLAPGMDYEEWETSTMAVEFFPQPLTDIYLHSDFQFDITAGGNVTQVWVLGLIGLFVLLMAGVNYINLTTASATLRAREVGVRKVMGAGKQQLVFQFLGETLLLGWITLLAAAGLSEVLLSWLNQLTGEPLLAENLLGWRQWGELLLFTTVISLLAGVYPAFYLTRFEPARVLKGEPTAPGRSVVRGSLVVLQFTIALALLICTFVVFSQLRYMQHKDKGFRHENVLVIRNMDDLGDQRFAFREQLAGHSQVRQTSFNSRMPAGRSIYRGTYRTEGMDQDLSLNSFPIDEHFLPVMGMRLLAGRNFSGDLATDSTNVLLNESAVRALGLEEPLGAVLNEDRRVIGVVADFNFDSFRRRIEPVVFTFDENARNLALQISGNDLPGLLVYLEESWQAFTPGKTLDYYFLDENMARLSEREAILSKAITFFTALAVFLACLGLFGLATFAAARRTREVGIRKVLGATVVQVTRLLSADFLKPVLLAFALAVPLAAWLSHRWLQDFVYRVELQWWMFVLPALGILLLALLTVSYQSVRAALNNPVEALRTE